MLHASIGSLWVAKGTQFFRPKTNTEQVVWMRRLIGFFTVRAHAKSVHTRILIYCVKGMLLSKAFTCMNVSCIILGFGAKLIGPIQRQNSSICNFLSGHCLDFFRPVSGKICHSSFKHVGFLKKRNPKRGAAIAEKIGIHQL